MNPYRSGVAALGCFKLNTGNHDGDAKWKQTPIADFQFHNLLHNAKLRKFVLNYKSLWHSYSSGKLAFLVSDARGAVGAANYAATPEVELLGSALHGDIVSVGVEADIVDSPHAEVHTYTEYAVMPAIRAKPVYSAVG